MHHTTASLLLFILIPTVLMSAQDDRQLRSNASSPAKLAGQTDARATTDQTDAILATWLHVGSMNEVHLAEVALKQALHKDVRAFAQRMVNDHKAWAEKLQPLTVASVSGDEPNADKDADTTRSDERGTSTTRGNPAPQRQGEKSDVKSASDVSSMRDRARLAPGGFDHAQLIRDLGRKCLQSESKMLGQKTGADFDLCFMRMQVASHMRCVDMIEVFKTYASSKLTPTLDAGHKTISTHLESAMSLCKQLQDQMASSGNGTGTPGGGSPDRGGR